MCLKHMGGEQDGVRPGGRKCHRQSLGIYLYSNNIGMRRDTRKDSFIIFLGFYSEKENPFLEKKKEKS